MNNFLFQRLRIESLQDKYEVNITVDIGRKTHRIMLEGYKLNVMTVENEIRKILDEQYTAETISKYVSEHF